MKKAPNNSEDFLLSDSHFEGNNFQTFLEKISDIASSPSLIKQTITSSGIHKQKAQVYIRNFEHPTNYVPVFCEISIGVDLIHYRGVHMSRYSESIFELASEKFDDLSIFAEKLAKTIRERQKSNIGMVDIFGTYIHRKLTKKSQLLSSDCLHLIARARSTKNEIALQTGMQVYNMTACPCTKTHTKYMIAPELKSLGLTIDQINKILQITMPATHTQRGTTTLIVDKEKTNISHQNIYSILEESTHLVYDLLKRSDEHDLVIRAIQNPQFTEDVAREVAANTYGHLKDKLSPNANVYIESILNDAIHIHDVRTVIESTMGNISQDLNS